MDKYDGMNKPEITLSANTCGASFRADKDAPDNVDKSNRDGKSGRERGGRIKSFFIRMVVAVILLAAIFFPRFVPYKGSENVTNAVKTVIMTDITGDKNIGKGKIADIIREIIENFNARK